MKDIAFLIISSLISFLGGIATARAYANRPAISYFVKNRYVLRPLGQTIPLELEIFHEKNKISNLVETKIAVWNSGTVPFNLEDISKSDPLCFLFSNARVIKIIGPNDSRKAIGPIIDTCAETSINVQFELLDRLDAFVFVVYSVVQDEEDASIHKLGTMDGGVKGIPHGYDRVTTIIRQSKLSWKAISFLVIMWLLSLSMLIRIAIAFTPYERYFTFDPIDVSKTSDLLGSLFFLLFFSSLLIGITYTALRVFGWWRKRPPAFVYDELLEGDNP